MNTKPCATCGINERHVSAGGKVLSYCRECNQQKWRKYKTPKNGGERANGHTTNKPSSALQIPKKRGPKPRTQPHEKVIKAKPVPKMSADEQQQLRLALIESRLEVARLRKLLQG